MKKYFILINCVILTACSTPPTPQQNEQAKIAFLTKAAKTTTFDRSDGISEVEAYIIADDYFLTKNKNLCGDIGIPKEEKTRWVVPIFEGYFPAHTKDLIIDKATGRYSVVLVKRKKA